MSVWREILLNALRAANEAISQDSKENYSSAIVHYDEAVSLLESEELLKGLVGEERVKLEEIVTRYQERMDAILNALPTSEYPECSEFPEWNFVQVPVSFSVNTKPSSSS